MLSPDRTKPVKHRISSYDLEWRWLDAGINSLGQAVKSLHVILVGVTDERGYRKYWTVEDFLRHELVPRNSGRRYYAHFGGASDMVFVLRELAKLDPRVGWTVEGVFSGSSAIFVRVSIGRHEWFFVDGYWTIRAPLRQIGDWLGSPKGDCDVQNAPMPEIIAYNERDCLIEYEALNRFQDAILAEGGELGITAASTALKTFRKKYLKRAIKNSPKLDE
jgi:hypothetical protein